MDFKAKPKAPTTLKTDDSGTLTTKDYVDLEISKLPKTDTTYTAGANVDITNGIISVSNLVTTNTAQTITAAKTFDSTAISLYLRRRNDSAGIYAGLMMERDTTSSSTTAPEIYGIGAYFKAKSRVDGTMTHAGLFGGRLTPAIDGETTRQVGEVVFSPAWNGTDPYTRADFRIRATSANTANTYLTGSMYVNSTSSGKNGSKVATENYVDNHITNYSTPHQYEDSGSSSNWSEVKYKLKIIDGKPYLEVVDV